MLFGMKAIGRKCQERRKQKQWTQQQAADAARVNRAVISTIENGKFTGSLKILTAYLLVLGLELSVKVYQVPQLDELKELFGDD